MFVSSRGPRTGRTLLNVLIAILVVLAGLAGWYWMQPATQPDLDEGRTVADKFLSDVRGGQAGAAWESTTAEFKSADGREQFLALVKSKPVLSQPLEFISAQTVTVLEQPRTEYLFRDPKDGATVRLVLGNEAGVWKVDRLLFD
jgi:hypothetical protein